MTDSEFSRPVRLDRLGAGVRTLMVEADAEERAALARRFGLQAVARLTAEVALRAQGAGAAASGTLSSAVTQACVVTGEPVEQEVEVAFSVLFLPKPETGGGEEEIELGAEEMDVVFFEGGAVDIGEAVAETLSLSLDPYPRSPGADRALKDAGVKDERDAGPFGALSALRDKMGK